MLKRVILGTCFLYGTNSMAQDDNTRKLELGLDFMSELQVTHQGDYNYVNLLQLNASLPISSSLTFDVASISTCMTAEESIGGDLQTFSNLDAGNIPFALSVLGVNWQINDRNSLFVGIRNINEDYFTSPVTSFFTNSSCGIYPTISANCPIANYPVASMGVHYCYDGTPVRVQASLYNGTGYNRFTGHDNVFRVCPKSDGVFGIAEVSYTRGGSSYFLGNAVHYKEVVSPSTKFRMNSTPWFYTEQSITSNLSMLAGYSHAFGTDIECRDFIGFGALYKLGKCHLGAFTDYANFREKNEFATELTCKIPISRHIDIQPTAHLITYDSKLHCVGMLRMAISL